MLTEKSFDTGTVRINYVEGPPSGMPLVFLHGVTTWWQTFLPVLPAFVIRYHTFALDLRGHGASGRTPGRYTIGNSVADVTAFVRNRMDAPAVLLGWSLGGMAAAFAAAHAPELVRALILVDPPLPVISNDDSSQQGFHERFAQLRDALVRPVSAAERSAALVELFPQSSEVEHRRRLKMLAGFDPEYLTVILEKQMFEQKRLEELLPQITCPVLLMQADPSLGGALDDKTVQTTRHMLDDCTHVYLAGVGHGIHVERPAAFVHIVTDFLESL